MNLSAPFIARPIATTLLMVGLLVGGLVCYRLLPVAALPDVNYPTLQVTAQLPGASPETVASSVTTPLETRAAAAANYRGSDLVLRPASPKMARHRALGFGS